MCMRTIVCMGLVIAFFFPQTRHCIRLSPDEGMWSRYCKAIEIENKKSEIENRNVTGWPQFISYPHDRSIFTLGFGFFINMILVCHETRTEEQVQFRPAGKRPENRLTSA